MYTIHPVPHQDILDAEQILEQAVWDALIAVCDTVADGIDNIVTAATAAPIPDDPRKAADAMVEAARGGKPGQPYVSVDDLATIMPAWQEQVDHNLQPLVAEIYSRSGQHISGQLAATLGPEFAIPPVSSVFAEDYLSQAANRLDNIGNTVWERARGELVTGFQNGESIPQLAARVRSAAPLSARAATAAARTEIVSASNAGSIATARAAGVEMDKQWLATKDGRTRMSHRHADGQKVAISEAFTVGGYSLDFPGDPGGPPSETDNCRCTLTYLIPDAAVNATHLPGPEVVPTAEEARNLALEQAARDRQDIIDERRKVANLAGEAQELTRYGWDAETMAHEIRAVGRRLHSDPAHVEELATLAGDQQALVEAAQALARSMGAEQQGLVGEVVRFDRTKHESIGAPLRDGHPVEIVRPGFTTQLPNRDQVRLSKALVEETDEPLGHPAPVTPGEAALTPEQLQQHAADLARHVGLNPALADELVERVGEFARAEGRIIANDGLDDLDLRQLRSLASEFQIPHPNDLQRDELLTALRDRKAVSPYRLPDLTDEERDRVFAAQIQAVTDVRNQQIAGYQPDMTGLVDLQRRVENVDNAHFDQLAGGEVGTVFRVQFPDGQQLFSKRNNDWFGRNAEHITDSEQLAFMLGRTLNAPIPRVLRDTEDHIYTDWAEGRAGQEFFANPVVASLDGPPDTPFLKSVVESGPGRRLGLMDILTRNLDRHTANWLVTDDGVLTGIDHGNLWWLTEGPQAKPINWRAMTDQEFLDFTSSELIGPFIRNGWYDWGLMEGKGLTALVDTEVWTRDDVATIRRKLEALRPDFVRLGHPDWLDYTLRLLDLLAPHAKGSRSIFLD